MSPNEIKRRFPNAGPGFIAANADRPLPDPEPQCDKTPVLARADEGKKEGVCRTRVRFIGYRVRPLDPDNFAGSCKDLLDGLRHANLVPGDEPWRIVFETEQVRVKTFKEEKTVIQLSPASEVSPDVAALRDALETLYDEQNGPPLATRAAQWQAAMEAAAKLIKPFTL